jgi:hypothetical protein
MCARDDVDDAAWAPRAGLACAMLRSATHRSATQGGGAQIPVS